MCGRPISRQTPQQIVDRVLELEEGTRFQVLAPVVRGRKGEYVELFRELQTKGYSPGPGRRRRASRSPSRPKLKKQEKHTIEVVVDRLAVKASAKRRLTDSVETALGLAGGLVMLDFVDLPEDDPRARAHLLRAPRLPLRRPVVRGARAAVVLVQLAVRRLPRVHRPRHPDGGRPGAGRPRPGATPAARARSRPWGTRRTTAEYFRRLLEALGEAIGFRIDTPWEQLPARAQKAVLHGHDTQVHVRYRNRYGRERSYYTGVRGRRSRSCERRHARGRDRLQPGALRGLHARGALPGLRRAPGSSPRSLAVTVGGRSIAEVAGAADRRVRGVPARRSS